MTVPLNTYGARQIRRFLEAVDRHLKHRTRLVVIGGGAAALAHHITSTTEDIDTFEAINAELRAAIALANEETRLGIVMEQSTVADVPLNYDDRLERQLRNLKRLEVWTLEKHDLVLSKAVRLDEHDLQQIAEMHDKVGLSFDILIRRFREEMSHVIGDPIRIRGNFLAMIRSLFGEAKAASAEKKIAGTK